MEEKNFLNEIEIVLNEKVRPSLMRHEGDVQIVSYEDHMLRVKLIGKCSNCPSALAETEDMIAQPLKDAFPEIEDVILIQEVSRELLDFARELLAHKKPE